MADTSIHSFILIHSLLRIISAIISEVDQSAPSQIEYYHLFTCFQEYVIRIVTQWENPAFSTHIPSMFPPNNGQVVLGCPHVLFLSKFGSTLMTIRTWRYRVLRSVKAAKLRTSFVLAGLTQSDRVKWRDKTGADGKLNRK